MIDHLKNFSLHDWLNYLLIRHQACHVRGTDHLAPVVNYYHLACFACPVIIVTGTNGKGSCINLLENIYKAMGYSVAAYTSPHCSKFNERISINGSPVSDIQIINAFACIEAACENINLRYFEFITLAALYIFKQASPDVILLEVGIGGRLDTVNIVDANLVILTTIGMDHTELLGNDLTTIAQEKIALFRSGRSAICGEISPPSNVFEYAKQLGASLYWIHRDFEYVYNLEQRIWHWQMNGIEYHELPMPRIKLQNAATVLAATVVLQNLLPINENAVIEGLINTQLDGRFEIFDSPCHCILDVAHNAQAVEWLIEQLQQLNIQGKVFAVFSMLKGKDISAIIKRIKPYIAAWSICPLKGFVRASAHADIMQTLQAEGVMDYSFFPSIAQAFSNARQSAGNHNYILVFGSFYLVAPVKAILLNDSNDKK